MVKMELPKVSYLKAIDVWMGTCMTFVFAAMIEFTIAHFIRTKSHSVNSEMCCDELQKCTIAGP